MKIVLTENEKLKLRNFLTNSATELIDIVLSSLNEETVNEEGYEIVPDLNDNYEEDGDDTDQDILDKVLGSLKDRNDKLDKTMINNNKRQYDQLFKDVEANVRRINALKDAASNKTFLRDIKRMNQNLKESQNVQSLTEEKEKREQFKSITTGSFDVSFQPSMILDQFQINAILDDPDNITFSVK